MLAANYDITIDRAAEYKFVLTLQNQLGQAVDLDPPDAGPYEFFADIRETVTKKEIVSFAASVLNDGDNGQVSFVLSEDKTLKLKPSTSYEYDIFMQRAGSMERLLYGSVTVRANITKGFPVDPIL
jgi:DNA helicase IV